MIEARLQPGVSVAGLALEHGVYTNQLRKWMRKGGTPTVAAKVPAPSAFIPVVAVHRSARTEYRLRATLRNAVIAWVRRPRAV